MGESEEKTTPFAIGFNSPIAQVKVGEDHLMILTKSNFVYVWGSNKIGQIGIGNEEFSKNVRVLILPKTTDEEEKKKSGWKKKKLKIYEVTKSSPANKIESKLIKKAEKKKDFKKNFLWKYISVSQNTSFAINGNFIFIFNILHFIFCIFIFIFYPVYLLFYLISSFFFSYYFILSVLFIYFISYFIFITLYFI